MSTTIHEGKVNATVFVGPPREDGGDRRMVQLDTTPDRTAGLFRTYMFARYEDVVEMARAIVAHADAENR